jgi:benzoate/toluate 1,2-dioxygenase beta subunit
MSTTLLRADAEDLLFREARHLDRGEWEAWIALYEPDCEFWMPAWLDETTPTSDPDTELSLIYYRGRRNLEDRVWRLRSGTSVASNPLPRVVHSITNVIVDDGAAERPEISASFAVHLHDARSRRTHVFFGRYEYAVRQVEGEWRIARKKIFLLNDVIPTVVDFFSI